MLTISVAEQEGVIEKKLKMILKERNKTFSSKEQDFLFLPPEPFVGRDVVLLHEPLACFGKEFTVLNADRAIESYNQGSLVITYGLNPLSTVTASSICEEAGETSFFCCLQRSFKTVGEKVLEPQEFPVVLPFSCPDISRALGVVTLGLVLSVKPEEFRYFQ